MPQHGTEVSVYFPELNENEAMTYSCVRRNGLNLTLANALGVEFSNPSTKITIDEKGNIHGYLVYLNQYTPKK